MLIESHIPPEEHSSEEHDHDYKEFIAYVRRKALGETMPDGSSNYPDRLAIISVYGNIDTLYEDEDEDEDEDENKSLISNPENAVLTDQTRHDGIIIVSADQKISTDQIENFIKSRILLVFHGNPTSELSKEQRKYVLKFDAKGNPDNENNDELKKIWEEYLIRVAGEDYLIR